MNQAFWEGFRKGFLDGSWYSIPIAAAFAIGLAIGLLLGSYSHPYEECKSMYETPEDISECVYIKENP